jgi:hypothetical protein
VSQQTFGSSQDDARCSTRCRRAEEASQQIERAADFIAQHSNLSNISIIAHSWGTNAAGLMTIRRPQLRQDQNPEQIEPVLDPRRRTAQREDKSTDEIEHQQELSHPRLSIQNRAIPDRPDQQLHHPLQRLALGIDHRSSAARTKSGREKLAIWLKHLENRSRQPVATDPMTTYDFAWLWRELKVEDLRR